MFEESIAEVVEDVEVVIGGIAELIDGLNEATLNAIVIEINPKGEFSVVGVLISGRELNG